MKDPDMLKNPDMIYYARRIVNSGKDRLPFRNLAKSILHIIFLILGVVYVDELENSVFPALCIALYCFVFATFPSALCNLVYELAGKIYTHIELPIEIRFYPNCLVVLSKEENGDDVYAQIEYDRIRNWRTSVTPSPSFSIKGLTLKVQFKQYDTDHTSPHYSTDSAFVVRGDDIPLAELEAQLTARTGITIGQQ